MAALAGVDCVVHTAARAAVMADPVADPLVALREVNVAGTRRLAEQAAGAGVRRLVFISSVKVNGERTAPEAPFLFSDTPAPEDAYAISKWEAEQALWQVAAQTGLEVVVVRPPLVYGPGVGGNFARLLGLVARGWPLPLGAVNNRRSLVALANLVDLLRVCVDHPAAAGRTFLVADGDDLSTPELLRRLALAMGRPVRLLPVPPVFLWRAGRLLGREAELARLLSSLQVDISFTRRTLGWEPPVRVDDALRETVEGWLSLTFGEPLANLPTL
ncbi:MAG: NAD-dependent epimerase/dehydratase family protein [Desulfurivibrio sp.]|nr:NAD-dependent epimerase/dehydratase family protein [Desulfurivibrio sp.]